MMRRIPRYRLNGGKNLKLAKEENADPESEEEDRKKRKIMYGV